MDALNELRRTIAKITEIQETILSEAHRAERRKRYLAEFRVGVDDYGNRTISEDLLEVASRAKAVISGELVDEVAAHHRAALRKASADLESVRAVLPSLAAKSAIELGILARSYEQEASNG